MLDAFELADAVVVVVVVVAVDVVDDWWPALRRDGMGIRPALVAVDC